MMKVEHYGFLTVNMMKSVSQFKELGYEQSTSLIYDDYRKINIIFMENQYSKIELVEAVGNDSIVSSIINTKKNMIYHTCYVCSDINQSIEQLENKGFILISQPAPAIAFDGRLVAFMMSKYAGMIELLEEEKC